MRKEINKYTERTMQMIVKTKASALMLLDQLRIEWLQINQIYQNTRKKENEKKKYLNRNGKKTKR